MCLPTKTDLPDSSGSHARSMLSMGALMLLACLGGPVIAGAEQYAGAGGVAFALGLCAAVPAVLVALRRRSAWRSARPEL